MQELLRYFVDRAPWHPHGCHGEGKVLPLCYVDVTKNQNGNIYNCNSVNEGNDYQKLQNFYTGLKQSQYTFNQDSIEKRNDSNNGSIIYNMFHFLNSYNPILLKNKIKKLEDKIKDLENKSI